MKEKLTYRFAKSKDEREAYYLLRDVVYQKEYGIVRSSDVVDTDSEVLIVCDGRVCVGGVRLNVCGAGEAKLLPMEVGVFRLKNLLPQLKLEKHIYAEISDVVFQPGFKGVQVMDQVYRRVNLKAKQLGVRYIFMVTSALNARRHIKKYQRLGFKSQLFSKVKIPALVKYTYGGAVEHLAMFDLEPRNISPLIERHFKSLDAKCISDQDIYEVLHYFSYIKDKGVRKDILDLLKVLSAG